MDLTPAAVGPYVVPPINLEDLSNEQNVNLVTCGGQATTPLVHAVARIARVDGRRAPGVHRACRELPMASGKPVWSRATPPSLS